MSELRYDPLEDRWVIIAEERINRPSDFERTGSRKAGRDCPFCEGNEKSIPPEIWAARPAGSKPDTPGWTVRVIPNKYAALSPENEWGRQDLGVYERIEGVGAHEVIIESPRHDLILADLSLDQFRLILETYRSRLRELSRDTRLKHILIFKNHGKEAGATLIHPHSQVIATPIIPRNAAIKLGAAQSHFFRTGRCLTCDIIDQELNSQSRLISSRDGIAAFTPFASRFPYEVLIAPLKHGSSLTEADDDTLYHLAGIFRDILSRIKRLLHDPPYNFILNSFPPVGGDPRFGGERDDLKDWSHWHIEIIPRLTYVAGFEWGSGFHINSISPEKAAKFLRDRDSGPSRSGD